jgi:DeoR family transcriptional regulator, fructose operon transcriptional repressor
MKEIESKYQQERLIAILELLKSDGRVSVADLSRQFGVSGVTIRNDLRMLHAEGKLIKTFGGAIYRENKTAPGLFDARNTSMTREKKLIAGKAAGLVAHGEVIYLDASVTVMEMIPFILDRTNLTVITNSLEVASNLSILSDHSIIMLGGAIFKESFATTWAYPEIIAPDVNIGTAFFGALGFSARTGLTDRNINVIHQKRYILGKSHRAVALIDSSKWGRISFGTFARPEQIGLIISDKGAPAGEVEALRRSGVEVVLV